MENFTSLTKEQWEKYLEGWAITDCAVRSRDFVYFCLRKDIPEEKASNMWDSQIPTRFFVLYLAEPQDERCGSHIWKDGGFNHPHMGVALLPKPQGIMASRDDDGNVYAAGSGSTGMEQIAPNGYPGTKRIKCINGYAYSVGLQREIFKRVDIGKWERFADLPDHDRIELVGFADMDAFSEDEMYAVGGHGDVWMYNGKEWQPTGFPTNEQLATVTCAGDGNVYISSEGGSLWRGRKSTWESIYRGASSILWNDAVWFEDKLWLSSDYQFRVWNGKTLEQVTHNGEMVPINGHMDARDGLLVVASTLMGIVMAYDGKEWRTLIAPY